MVSSLQAEGVFHEIRWLEDFAAGQAFTFGYWTMEAGQMIEFAEIYDPEPFHLSDDQARALGWRGLIASGLQIASIWRRLSKSAFPNANTVISPGWDDIRWLAPVYAGDVLGSRTRILETRALRSRPGEGLVVLGNEVFRQGGEPVARLKSTWFVRRRS